MRDTGPGSTLEAFAFDVDREAAVARLVPGSREHGLLHVLSLQHAGKLDAAREALVAIRDRWGAGEEFRLLERRQDLLGLDADLARGCDRIAAELNLTFSHQREVSEAGADEPAAFDPEEVSEAAFLAEALRRRRDGRYIEDAYLLTLLDAPGVEAEAHARVAHRARRPDHPGLVDLLLQDLSRKDSGGFGSRLGHSRLTDAQLDELAGRLPSLRGNARWVEFKLRRLAPPADVEWMVDREARAAYLDRLWGFVEGLGHDFRSLQVAVLYRKLELARDQGRYPRDLLLQYLAMPRDASYLAKAFLKARHRGSAANLSDHACGAAGLEPVGNDRALVEAFLHARFVEGDAPEAFEAYVDRQRLDELHATARILSGAPDLERWTARLAGADAIEALKRRVELTWRPENPEVYAGDAPVTLRADVKNVEALTVKVFEIDAESCYRQRGGEIDTTIDLDGLVATFEEHHRYDHPPFVRHTETFAFPDLARPGVFCVELIGGGRSSRALIRKGQLRFTDRLGAAGHVLRVFDEGGVLMPDATLTLGGRTFAADAHGEIAVGFADRPGPKWVTLEAEGRTTRAVLHHTAEAYSLRAALHVEREALQADREAVVVARPELFVGSSRVSPKLLDDLRLTLHTLDAEGVSASREVEGVELTPEGDVAVPFRVPPRLTRLELRVAARVTPARGGAPIELSAADYLDVGAVEGSDRLAVIHLQPTTGGLVALVLGRTGEPRPGMNLRATFGRDGFGVELVRELGTDAAGRIELGALEPGLRVTLAGTSVRTRTFVVPRPQVAAPPAVHVRAGEAVRVAAPGLKTLRRGRQGLLSRRTGSYLADWFDALRLEDGALVADGLPVGEYDLFVDAGEPPVDVCVSAGREAEGWLLAPAQELERAAGDPLRIVSAELDGEGLRARVLGGRGARRVYVAATRFLSEPRLFQRLAALGRRRPGHVSFAPARTGYASNRELGEEIRYVLERRTATRRPGTLLERPSLLLNPWAVRTTKTKVKEAAEGGAFDRRGGGGARDRMAHKPAASVGHTGDGFDEPSHDVLEAAPVLRCLVPDADGWVRLPATALRGLGCARVVAYAGGEVAERPVALAEVRGGTRDLRLLDGLDPAETFAERRKVTPLAPEDALTLEHLAGAAVQRYGTVAQALQLYDTLLGEGALAEFAFLGSWHTLTPDEKRERYDERACHELHLFLERKDPAFFAAAVRPYLANKLEKTFIDHLLLGADLTPYLDPWAYAQLNAAEQALLAQRVPGEQEATARQLAGALQRAGRDLEDEQARFAAALRGGSLDDQVDGVATAIAQEKERAVAKGGRARMKKRAGPPPMAEAMSMACPPPAPGAAYAAKAEAAFSEVEEECEPYLDDADDEINVLGAFFDEGGAVPPPEDRDLAKRAQAQAFYETLERTQEWAERRYWGLEREQIDADLIEPGALWRDLAAHRGGPFLSPAFLEACRTPTEARLALAVLDLPLLAEPPEVEAADGKVTLTARTPLFVCHRETEPAAAPDGSLPILVNQSYLEDADRTRYEDGEEVERYVTGEMQTHTVYVCHLAVTNPTGRTLRLELLTQIPEGALPVSGNPKTKGRAFELDAYETETFEYAFYFPAPGTFEHYPASVARDEAVVAQAAARPLTVVREPSQKDVRSWGYVSQDAPLAELLAYLERENLVDTDLDEVAWRMRERAAYDAVLEALTGRRVFDETLWSYALLHRDRARVGTYLRHQDHFLSPLGPCFAGTGFAFTAEERGEYEHLEYAPLVNARAHPLGERKEILNDRLEWQYGRWLLLLALKPALRATDRLALAYYLLLQDRVDEAHDQLQRVEEADLETALQLAYLRCYVCFLGDEPEQARALAEPHGEHPVPRWRRRFRSVLQQLDEAQALRPETEATARDAEESRDVRQEERLAKEPALDVTMEAGRIGLRTRNLDAVELRFYEMDLELLFSQEPFVQGDTSRFQVVRPNRVERVEMAGAADREVPLPEPYQKANVVIEARARGLVQAVPHFAHALQVHRIEAFGQVEVRAKACGRPLPKVYVKAYARRRDGSVKFVKDGYTDLRGRFDYASVSTNDLDHAERFALLVASDDHGSLVLEAAPPRR